jgi:hypothetical protein
MADYSWLSSVKDPAVKQALKQIMVRVFHAHEKHDTLEKVALKKGSPVDGYGERIKHVASPKESNDVVNLSYLRAFVSTQIDNFREELDTDGDGIPDAGGGGDNLGGIGAGSAPPTVELPDMKANVEAYNAANPGDFANHCVTSGGSWAYMTGLVAYLQGIDPRVGGNGKRGDTSDPSIDAVSYYHGVLPPIFGSKDVYVVDVIAASCSPAAAADWNDVTTPRAAGAWLPSVP